MSDSGDPTSACALLVVSCDAYADLWAPFFALLRRHWPDQPFPAYLGAGELEAGEPGVTTLSSLRGRDWSGCVRDYLDRIPHPYVLMMLDDFFLRGPVPTALVVRCLEFARRQAAVQVRLLPRPGPTDRVAGEALVGECQPGLPYRLSTQAAIWDRAKLRDLLRPGETIWEFEHEGNRRAAAQAHGFYATRTAVLPYAGLLAHHVVEKGRWLPHERWIFARQRIGCDFSRRGTLPWRQVLLYHAVQAFDRALDLLPWRLKAGCKRGLRRALSPLLGRQLARLGGRASPEK